MQRSPFLSTVCFQVYHFPNSPLDSVHLKFLPLKFLEFFKSLKILTH